MTTEKHESIWSWSDVNEKNNQNIVENYTL